MTLFQATLNFAGEAPAILPGASSSFGDWVTRILSGVIAVAALLVFIYLLWGAISWVTSGGDSSKTQKARDMMTQAVIGLIVLAASTAIFMLVQNFLGLSVLNFSAAPAAVRDEVGVETGPNRNDNEPSIAECSTGRVFTVRTAHSSACKMGSRTLYECDPNFVRRGSNCVPVTP